MKKLLCVLFAALMLLSLAACGKSADPWQEQYDLGVRYLSEGNYEEAIIAFTAAIEIDPKREEAYVGLADVYYATGDTAKAEEILAQMPWQEGTVDDAESGGVRTERYDNEDGSYTIVEYNAEGYFARSTYYDADGTMGGYTIYEYNSEGICICEYQYDADGVLDRIEEFAIIAERQYAKVRETDYNDDGTIQFYIIHEYDNAGNYVRDAHYNGDGTLNFYTNEN